MKQPCVYILASAMRGTLYVGVTGDLVNRLDEHRRDVVPGFTNRYGVHLLVWYELHPDFASAIHRETCIKRWRRVWKLRLIEAFNADWRDLWNDVAVP